MAKYNDLVKQYAGEIAEIKRLQVQEKEAKQKVDEFGPTPEWTTSDYEKYDEVCFIWQSIQEDLHAQYDKLTQDIEAEYWNVPFVASRKKGIEKFFEVAGI